MDAGEASNPLAVADRTYAAAKATAVQYQHAEHGKDRQKPDGRGQSSQAAVEEPQQYRWGVSDGSAVTEHQRDAFKHASGRERRYDGRNLETGDENTIEEPNRPTDAESQWDGPNGRRIGRIGIGRKDDRREGDCPRHRKVEPTGCDDGPLPQSKNRQKAPEREQRDQISAEFEVGTIDRRRGSENDNQN